LIDWASIVGFVVGVIVIFVFLYYIYKALLARLKEEKK